MTRSTTLGSMKDKAPVKERLKIINWVKHGAEQQRWKNERLG
jgi:hypothetical protein